MSFLTWAALAVAALVAAPLVAHLLRRRPPDELPFAATKLVPASPAVAQRRTAIEDRALLAIRVLSVVALALLGATPFMTCSRLSLARDAGASVALAIVLDDSMSMRVALDAEDPQGSTTRFERAREAAQELLAGMQPGDAVAIVMAGDPVRVALAASTNLDAASGALSRVEQSDRGTDLSAAVSIAGELLSELEHVDKRVVVLSDLAGERAADLSAPEGVKLWFPLEELRGERRDCGVVHADRNSRSVAVRVACGPGKDKELPPRKIAITRGDEVIVSAPLRLEEGAVDLTLKLPEAASDDTTIRLYAALTGSADAIAENDVAPVVAIGGQLGVGVVSDPASSQVATGGPPAVEQAFKALSLGVQLRPLSAVPERKEELAPLGLLIVDDVPGFTPSQRRELAEWVTDGGVLLITLGPGAAAAPLGSSFAPMLPAVVRWSSRDISGGIDAKSDTFFGEAAVGMDALAAKGQAQLDLERDDAVVVAVEWGDGAPLLIEKRMGRGVAYTLTLPFDAEVSDLALRPGFLHLLSRLTIAARTLGGVARTNVGVPWQLDGFQDVAVTKVDRADRRREIEVETLGRSRKVIAETVGLYMLTLDGNSTSRVAAMDELEVDMRPRAEATSADDKTLGGCRRLGRCIGVHRRRAHRVDVRGAVDARAVAARPSDGRRYAAFVRHGFHRLDGGELRFIARGVVAGGVAPVAVLFGGEGLVSHLADVLRRGIADRVADLGEALGELGRAPHGHAEHVVADEHLSIAPRTGADADGRDVDRIADLRCDVGRHRLEHDGIGARLLQRDRVGDDALGRRVAFALHLETAQRMHRLRRETDVTHHRNAGADDAHHVLGNVLPALELDAFGHAFFDELAGVLERLDRRHLKAHERHVADHVRVLGAAGDGACVITDLIERDRDGALMTLHHHAEGVADE